MEKREMISEKNGKVCLHVWEPEGEVRALYQICHGMAEYVMRYDEFAKKLNENGYLVFGIDHPGHGESEGIRGHFANRGGWKYLVDCNIHAAEIMKERYPGKKLTLMGHSMGSFIARTIAGYDPDTADEYIFMGTAGPNPAVGPGLALASLPVPIGWKKGNLFLAALTTGPYAKAEKTYKTPYDWLNTKEDEVQKYIDDEKCGFAFTTAGYRALLIGLSKIDPKKWVELLDNSKRYLLVSGEKDPVGDMGKGVKKVYDAMVGYGLNTKMKLYEGCRHEILNDVCKEEVTSDILTWLKGE